MATPITWKNVTAPEQDAVRLMTLGQTNLSNALGGVNNMIGDMWQRDKAVEDKVKAEAEKLKTDNLANFKGALASVIQADPSRFMEGYDRGTFNDLLSAYGSNIDKNAAIAAVMSARDAARSEITGTQKYQQGQEQFTQMQRDKELIPTMQQLEISASSTDPAVRAIALKAAPQFAQQTGMSNGSKFVQNIMQLADVASKRTDIESAKAVEEAALQALQNVKEANLPDAEKYNIARANFLDSLPANKKALGAAAMDKYASTIFPKPVSVMGKEAAEIEKITLNNQKALDAATRELQVTETLGKRNLANAGLPSGAFFDDPEGEAVVEAALKKVGLGSTSVDDFYDKRNYVFKAIKDFQNENKVQLPADVIASIIAQTDMDTWTDRGYGSNIKDALNAYKKSNKFDADRSVLNQYKKALLGATAKVEKANADLAYSMSPTVDSKSKK